MAEKEKEPRWADEVMVGRFPPDDIWCKTCAYKMPPVEVQGEIIERHTFGTCKKFADKPDDILWYGEECRFYKKEKEKKEKIKTKPSYNRS